MLPTLNHEETIFKEFSYAFTFLCRRLNPDRYCGPVLKPKVLWIFKKIKNKYTLCGDACDSKKKMFKENILTMSNSNMM